LIGNYIERETTGATKRVGDEETAIKQERGDTQAARNAGVKTGTSGHRVHAMKVAI
jgi:hypothetical protein